MELSVENFGALVVVGRFDDNVCSFCRQRLNIPCVLHKERRTFGC